MHYFVNERVHVLFGILPRVYFDQPVPLPALASSFFPAKLSLNYCYPYGSG